MKSIHVIITTYNNENCIGKLLESILRQKYEKTQIIIADDGSTDKTLDVIQSYVEDYNNIKLLALTHGERGAARAAAISELEKDKPDFILILDSDMILQDNLLRISMKYFERNPTLGGMVIKEVPFSKHKNLATKVKVFERKVINNSKMILDDNSIEAARIWKYEEFIKSGGINPNQISFEETQPTIRYREMGGVIIKLPMSGLMHDEKKVTIRNLFLKKNYHFKMIGRTLDSEAEGLLKAAKRWYFFRPVMYRKENIKLYFKHPLLTALMIIMYLGLSFIAVGQVITHKVISQ